MARTKRTAAKSIQSEITRAEYMRLTMLLMDSSSKLEDAVYERELAALCDRAFAGGDDTELEAALSDLKESLPMHYDELLSLAEETVQYVVEEHSASLLILVPVMVWSRYCNYAGTLDEGCLSELAELYRKTLTSGQARVTIGNEIFTAENIPERLEPVRSLLYRMRDSESTVVDIRDLITKGATSDFADSRFLVICVTASNAEKLFRDSKESAIERARAAMVFCREAHDLLQFPLMGSMFEVQPPASFYAAWRQSEMTMRIWALKSLVNFVESMGHSRENLTASIGSFEPGSRSVPDLLPELRIGMCAKNDPSTVIAGIAWPMNQDEGDQPMQLACDVLTTVGVPHIVVHPQSFTLEWCEDCGCPMYANAEGLVVHVEPDDGSNPKATPPTLN